MGARVSCSGRHIHRHASRHYFGRVFATGALLALRLPVYDTPMWRQVLRASDAVRQVFSTPFRSRWVFDVEILARYLATTERAVAESRIYELPLTAWREYTGSKVTIFRHGIRAFWDLAMIGLKYSR